MALSATAAMTSSEHVNDHETLNARHFIISSLLVSRLWLFFGQLTLISNVLNGPGTWYEY